VDGTMAGLYCVAETIFGIRIRRSHVLYTNNSPKR
jgi:hypothetical protein